jgi:antitoxin VapB
MCVLASVRLMPGCRVWALDTQSITLQNTHIDVCTKENLMPATLSRVFMNGNSQAVRIPQEFRLATNRVEIFRNADGDLVLHPVPADRGAALLEALKGFDDEFVALLEAGLREQLPMQDRESL